jgi:hypothetical protein
MADRTSKQYMIQRGTKQGDPLNPKLFNAVLEEVLGKIQDERMAKEGLWYLFWRRTKGQTLQFAFCG